MTDPCPDGLERRSSAPPHLLLEELVEVAEEFLVSTARSCRGARRLLPDENIAIAVPPDVLGLRAMRARAASAVDLARTLGPTDCEAGETTIWRARGA